MPLKVKGDAPSIVCDKCGHGLHPDSSLWCHNGFLICEACVRKILDAKKDPGKIPAGKDS